MSGRGGNVCPGLLCPADILFDAFYSVLSRSVGWCSISPLRIGTNGDGRLCTVMDRISGKSRRMLDAAKQQWPIKNSEVAEGEGFEPPEGLRPQRFSRPPQSTALPPLRMLKT